MADTKDEHTPNQHGSVNPETEPKADIPSVEEKRKPGRPPKATKPTDGTNTNYTPSIDRNEDDQAAQPTGLGSGVAGYGDWSDFDESQLEDVEGVWVPERIDPRMSTLVSKENDSPPPIQAAPKDDKLFPVRILRNYKPMTDRWYPILRNGKVGRAPRNDDGSTTKIMKGFSVLLPLTEAKQVIQRGIGERADALPS